MRFRELVLKTHRWIGLGSAIVLAVVGTTGAVLLVPGRSLIRRISGPMHQNLWLGQVGWWVVVIATILAVLLEAGGAYLWWRRKSLRVRLGGGWRRVCTDLHHAAGALGFVLMFILAASGVGMSFVTPSDHPELRRVILAWHTSKGFPLPVKVLYAVGTLGFLVQGVTGVAMWWRPRPSGSPIRRVEPRRDPVSVGHQR